MAVQMICDEKSRSLGITERESQIEKIDALAEAAGMTRSGYMVRSAIGLGEEQRAVRAKSRGVRAR